MFAASQVMWYLTRGTGAVSLVLLTLSAALGMIVTISWGSDRLSRLVINGLHRNVSLLVMVFVVIHVVTTVLDTFVKITFVDAFVPFVSAYRPIWVGLGAVAWDLILALVITSLLRVRIGLATWRIVHWSAYACLPVAVVHALGTGSDVRSHLMVWLVIVCGVVLLASFVWRLSVRRLPTVRATAFAVAAAVVVPLGIALWAMSGPLAAGWAKKSAEAPRTPVVVAAVPAPDASVVG